MSSDEEKLGAFVLHRYLPVAVLDLATLAKLGDWELINKDVFKEKAVRLTNVKHQILARYIGNHIWVSPKLDRKQCREAWVNAGFEKPMNPKEQIDFRLENGLGPVPEENHICVHHLDHVHAKEWGVAQGYGYVLLMNVHSGANLSAGSIEGKMKRRAEKYGSGYAKEHPVFYAEEIHWRKLQDVGQGNKPTPGIRVR